MERFGPAFLIAGVVTFLLGFFLQGVMPIMTLRNVPVQSVEEVAPEPTDDFLQLAEDYPAEFQRELGAPDEATFVAALKEGKALYIAEACWHCHSQFVRPVSNEDRRFGAVSYPGEYQNELQLPQLFGTRRVGPDLIRSSGKHSNDWHVAHFWEPRDVVPSSVMPSFPWFFDPPADASAAPQPNQRGLAIVAFVQWLGSWAEQPDAPLLPLLESEPAPAAATAGWPGAPAPAPVAGGAAPASVAGTVGGAAGGPGR